MAELMPETKHTYPLDSGDDLSDIVLKTSDGHTFHTHKLFLRMHSKVLNSMFAAGGDVGEEVKISETSSVMEALLTFIYKPDDTRHLFSAADPLIAAIRAADKYGMSKIREKLILQLDNPCPPVFFGASQCLTIVQKHFFRLYTVGHLMDLEAMKEKAWCCLKSVDLDLEPDFPEIHQMSADWYRALKTKQRKAGFRLYGYGRSW